MLDARRGVEDHGGALVERVRIPLRQVGVVRVTGAGEGDNDYMFHRVASIGDAEKWPLAQRFSIHARLEFRGDTACVVDGDEVAVTYNIGEVRASLLWRGLTFADANDDEDRRFDEHLDDLDLGTIERVFRDDLGARGRQAPASHGIPAYPAWLAVLNETYGFTSPDVS